MTEKAWVLSFRDRLQRAMLQLSPKLFIEVGRKVPYAQEVLTYSSDEIDSHHSMKYETDILIGQKISRDQWSPRVIIEGKIESVTTHDAITYSQKSATHKSVHPYLRYGILLGNRGHYPLPGRLFRHGAHFDFMLSWQGFKPTISEWRRFVDFLEDELAASRHLEEIIFNSRSKNRKPYTLLHRPLRLM